MSAAMSVAVAVVFVWLGMVLAISFLEAPLKFRAPQVTLPIGLGIGRVVFRALNRVEAALALTLVAAVVIASPSARAGSALGVAIAALVAQVATVRPRLARRTDHVLAGGGAESRSHAHYLYLALELTKVAALVAGGWLLLAG